MSFFFLGFFFSCSSSETRQLSPAPPSSLSLYLQLSLSHLRVQVCEPRQDLAQNRRGQRLRKRAVPASRRQGPLQRARGAVLEHEREVAAGGKCRRAPDDVAVAEGREQPDLPGEGRRGPGRGERQPLDGDDGAREGVDGAEDLVGLGVRVVAVAVVADIWKEGNEEKKWNSQPFFASLEVRGIACKRCKSARVFPAFSSSFFPENHKEAHFLPLEES